MDEMLRKDKFCWEKGDLVKHDEYPKEEDLATIFPTYYECKERYERMKENEDH